MTNKNKTVRLVKLYLLVKYNSDYHNSKWDTLKGLHTIVELKFHQVLRLSESIPEANFYQQTHTFVGTEFNQDDPWAQKLDNLK